MVSIASTDPNSERIFAFNIAPLRVDDLRADTEVVIEVVAGEGDRMGLNVWREQGQKRVGEVLALEPLPATAQDCSRAGAARTVFDWIARPAFAQDGNAADLASLLNSDDTFTRRDARIELAGQGPAAFDAIAGYLASGTYRLQVGALVALGGMAPDQRCAAPPEVTETARALAAQGDDAMRAAAQTALAGC